MDFSYMFNIEFLQSELFELIGSIIYLLIIAYLVVKWVIEPLEN